MRTGFRHWCRALSWLAGLLLLSACNSPFEHSGTKLQDLRASGVIRVGYANEIPYAYLDSQTGKLTGEAPAIAEHILKRLGIERVEPVLTEFGALIPGLKAHRFDMIAAGMYILPERCSEVSFSNPTYSIGEGFIVKSGNPLALHSYADIAKRDDARIGVVAGAVERRYAQQLGIPDERIVVFPNLPSALAGVEAGRVDAAAGTSLSLRLLAQKEAPGRVQLAKPFYDPVVDGKPVRGYGAFVFRREDYNLVATFNAHLKSFIGTPEHLELIKPFGFTRVELPGRLTAEQLCER